MPEQPEIPPPTQKEIEEARRAKQLEAEWIQHGGIGDDVAVDENGDPVPGQDHHEPADWLVLKKKS